MSDNTSEEVVDIVEDTDVQEPLDTDKRFSDFLREEATGETPVQEVDEEVDEPNEEEEEPESTEDADLKFLANNKERIGQLLELERKLSNPDEYVDVLKALVNGVATMHKADVSSIFGGAKDISDDDEGEFDTDYEKALYEKAKRAAIVEFKSELQPLQEELKRLKAAEDNRIAQRDLASKVEQGYAKWSSRIEKATGFKPSRSQVEQALRDHPSLEPIKAIQLAHMDDIIKLTSKQASRNAPKAPTLVNRSTNSGKATTGEKRFSDFLREANEAS